MKNSKKLQKVALMARVNKFLNESKPKEPSRASNAIKGLK